MKTYTMLLIVILSSPGICCTYHRLQRFGGGGKNDRTASDGDSGGVGTEYALRVASGIGVHRFAAGAGNNGQQLSNTSPPIDGSRTPIPIKRS